MLRFLVNFSANLDGAFTNLWSLICKAILLFDRRSQFLFLINPTLYFISTLMN